MATLTWGRRVDSLRNQLELLTTRAGKAEVTTKALDLGDTYEKRHYVLDCSYVAGASEQTSKSVTPGGGSGFAAIYFVQMR